MKFFIRVLDYVFNRYHYQGKRAATRMSPWGQERTYDAPPTRFGQIPDLPLNRLERCFLFLAKVSLEKLRKCDLCRKSNEQQYFIRFDSGHEVHVDCGAEHNDACRVDPTTRYIEESDRDYDARMVVWDRENLVAHPSHRDRMIFR